MFCALISTLFNPPPLISRTFARQIISQRGKATPIPPAVFDLPATPQQLQEDNLTPDADALCGGGGGAGGAYGGQARRGSVMKRGSFIPAPSKRAPVPPATQSAIRAIEEKYAGGAFLADR